MNIDDWSIYIVEKGSQERPMLQGGRLRVGYGLAEFAFLADVLQKVHVFKPNIVYRVTYLQKVQVF